MNTKQAFVVFFVLFSCYLILSITFVSAYSIGEVINPENAGFAIKPVMAIVDELEPINCESSGSIDFRAYVENVPDFDIIGMEALVEDKSTGFYYNVTSAVSCSPQRDVISNQEIKCRLSVKELLSQLPECPLDRIVNDFYLTFTISYVNREEKVSAEKDLTMTEAGVKPDMRIDFYVSSPPYPVPEINCLTGSEFDVPVIIEHAETLSGKLAWSFSLDGTAYGGNLMECDKITERMGEGREDIYLCTLTVADTLFPACEAGREVVVGITVSDRNRELSDSFATSLLSEELSLSMKLGPIGKVECQIVSEEGKCIPSNPQQNVTATITGNVPRRIDVIETKYRIDDGNMTTTYCRKLAYDKYQCITFITVDTLDLPEEENGTTIKEREIEAYFEVKYLNYYTNVTDDVEFEMEGRMVDELINTLSMLEEDSRFLEWVANCTDTINKIYEIVMIIDECCGIGELKEEMKKDDWMKIIKKFFEMFIWGAANKWWEKVYNTILTHGPGIVACVAEEGIEEIEEQMETLQEFEEGTVTSEIDIPTAEELMEKYILECTAENFWEKIKSKKWVLLCIAIRIILNFAGVGIAEQICNIWKNPVFSKIRDIYKALVLIVNTLLMINSMSKGLKSIGLAAERMNLQLRETNLLSEYMEYFQATMEAIAAEMASNIILHNITYGSYGNVRMIYISDRLGPLAEGDEICTGDEVSIEYDLERLNQSETFVSEIRINSPTRSGPTLLLEKLKGTYGPVGTDSLLGTDPLVDPSEIYTFTLNFQERSYDFDLSYKNIPCKN